MGRKSVKQQFPVIATALTVCAVVVLCTLGAWQMKRLHWKEDILTAMQSARAAGPQDIAFQDIDGSGTLYVQLRGRYSDRSFPVGPRSYDGVTGFHILVPFATKDGGFVLVNRGWVPQGEENNVRQPEGIIRVSGLLRAVEKGNPFIPPNDPDGNIWFQADLVQMARLADTAALAPLVMYAESENPESTGLQPVRAALQWSPPNDHLHYALFWFAMAGVLLIVYYFRFWR